MHAALGRREDVDLVDDDGVHGHQGRGGLRAKDQEQRFRRGHQDVVGLARLLTAVAGGGVAGAHVDPDVADGVAESVGRALDADERRAQVALDVVDEGFQRRDVEHANAWRGVGRLALAEVDRPEERGERLAAAGGRDEEGVFFSRQHLPAESLDVGWLGEARVEPGADGWGESVHCSMMA